MKKELKVGKKIKWGGAPPPGLFYYFFIKILFI